MDWSFLNTLTGGAVAIFAAWLTQHLGGKSRREAQARRDYRDMITKAVKVFIELRDTAQEPLRYIAEGEADFDAVRDRCEVLCQKIMANADTVIITHRPTFERALEAKRVLEQWLVACDWGPEAALDDAESQIWDLFPAIEESIDEGLSEAQRLLKRWWGEVAKDVGISSRSLLSPSPEDSRSRGRRRGDRE